MAEVLAGACVVVLTGAALKFGPSAETQNQPVAEIFMAAHKPMMAQQSARLLQKLEAEPGQTMRPAVVPPKLPAVDLSETEVLEAMLAQEADRAAAEQRQRLAREEAAKRAKAAEIAKADDDAFEMAERVADKAAFETYLEMFPEGRHVETVKGRQAELARRETVRLTSTTPIVPTVAPASAPDDEPTTVVSTQESAERDTAETEMVQARRAEQKRAEQARLEQAKRDAKKATAAKALREAAEREQAEAEKAQREKTQSQKKEPKKVARVERERSSEQERATSRFDSDQLERFRRAKREYDRSREATVRPYGYRHAGRHCFGLFRIPVCS